MADDSLQTNESKTNLKDFVTIQVSCFWFCGFQQRKGLWLVRPLAGWGGVGGRGMKGRKARAEQVWKTIFIIHQYSKDQWATIPYSLHLILPNR